MKAMEEKGASVITVQEAIDFARNKSTPPSNLPLSLLCMRP